MMTYIVTGAAGFIGSNIIKGLNQRGITDVIAVDDLTHGDRFVNLADCQITDYWDKQEFIDLIRHARLNQPRKQPIKAILHQGACSDTTESNGRFMMENNYRYSRDLFDYCQSQGIAFIYASSAATYGEPALFAESLEYEKPLNVYGYSKFLFDQYVRAHQLVSQVVGLRYFNVYGAREQHKGRMASVAFHFFNQYQKNARVKLFTGSGGYVDGEQRRDFVSVEDVVKVNLFFLDHPQKSGIFNCGTGLAQSFNDVAVATINTCRRAQAEKEFTLLQMQEAGLIEYIAFPEDLKGKYQSFTQAELSRLRAIGYDEKFLSVEEGVSRYVSCLIEKS